MTNPGGDNVYVDDGAFQHVAYLVNIINTLHRLQTKAQANIEHGMSLPNVFVDKAGAALHEKFAEMPQALADSRNNFLDLTELGITADDALSRIKNVDKVRAALFRPLAAVHGDPKKDDFAGSKMTPEKEMQRALRDSGKAGQ
ncbi:hypothetical protein [Amycolatopsis taiwanensis]|uniref:Uncharacterized protein n=1 Tax=Amycolatopsis taiwanensis TaxID=342230 RepID=A0A9W6VER3_9PSEU|nr:hypothetical protein [Amycolatopsis taiwanensis]GLY64732.1 hypothetical protein Atai01_13510 [Amycolatopsis taiwanensis]